MTINLPISTLSTDPRHPPAISAHHQGGNAIHYQFDLYDDGLSVYDYAVNGIELDPVTPEYGAAINRLLDARDIDAIQLVHAVQRRGYSVGARHDDGIDGPAVPVECAPEPDPFVVIDADWCEPEPAVLRDDRDGLHALHRELAELAVSPRQSITWAGLRDVVQAARDRL